MISYDIPEGYARSTLFHVKIDGKPIDVASTEAADFVTLAADQSFTVEVTVAEKIKTVHVRPLRKGITPTVEGTTVHV